MTAAPIEITVSGDVPCSAHQAYQALWHCERFSDWWPVPTRVQTGQAILVQPLPFIGIQMIRTGGESPRTVVYEYASGPFRGEGEWSITDAPDHPGWAHVEYTVRLRPMNALVAVGAATPMFRNKHRRDIQAILKRICTVPPID